MRSSGILLPLSSLPSPFGIGSLGREAYDFVDFLEKSGQTYWQMLPIGPTNFGDSPYQSFSAFACNPYFIDLDILREKGLLTGEETEEEKEKNTSGTVDYGRLYRERDSVLRKAALRAGAVYVSGESQRNSRSHIRNQLNRLLSLLSLNKEKNEWDFQRFKEENSFWLYEYTLFMAIKEENGGLPFREWPKALREREPWAVSQAENRLKSEMDYFALLQYFFFIQWQDLKAYANSKGIRLIGDIPIYVSSDSAELWAEKELFIVNDQGEPTVQAGCPPDAFSETGQLWGNPIYDWEYHKKTGYSWWIKRLEHGFRFFDVLRIDHFRGLAGYYEIPAGAENAVKGQWKEGPGISFIKAVKEALPQAKIIAEDLGYMTEDVKELLGESGFPGMKVLQFAFSTGPENDYLPHHYEKNCVAYTGTHDNTTAAGWKKTAPTEEVSFAQEYLGIKEEEDFTKGFIEAVMASLCDTAVIPMADWLGLGEEGRINIPGTIGGNWKWRLQEGELTEALALEIRRKTEACGRLK